MIRREENYKKNLQGRTAWVWCLILQCIIIKVEFFKYSHKCLLKCGFKKRLCTYSNCDCFLQLQKVQELRVEIQRLQEECKKMTQEVDLSLDAQVPLGETDEEFYKNIYTGQQGFILPPSSQPPPPSEFCELKTKRWRIMVLILIVVFCSFLWCILQCCQYLHCM